MRGILAAAAAVSICTSALTGCPCCLVGLFGVTAWYNNSSTHTWCILTNHPGSEKDADGLLCVPLLHLQVAISLAGYALIALIGLLDSY